ncbi:MAG: GNAT family N-acetyltransferase [Rhodospirillaceae bacterium]|nr:GNAT family N-acetyltransferase [Rhodospirillaceae bacterium]|tara:strand:+ start:480 stop:944 length:465 start_codon:yes stop_codon:yes gene_type:complete
MNRRLTCEWTCAELKRISVTRLHEILKIRQQVFIIEQTCIYSDIDDYDILSSHLLGINKQDELIAYCRIIPPGTIYEEAAIGRVLVEKKYRGMGLGRELMLEAHKHCRTLYGTRVVRLNAQEYLKKFYESLGYRFIAGPHDEDGVLHIEMLKSM